MHWKTGVPRTNFPMWTRPMTETNGLCNVPRFYRDRNIRKDY
jgi:hypothetical protein